MEVGEQIKVFKEFIERNYEPQLLETVRKGNDFLVMDFFELTKFNPELAEELLESPEEILKAGELAIKEFDLPKKIEKFHIRFKNLPGSQKILISEIRSKHLNKFLWTEGVVRQKSDVRPHVVAAKFECPSCGNVLTVLQLENKFREPSRCACGRKGKFKELSKDLMDGQGLVLEEAPEDLEGGAQPKRMNVFLKNDLVSPITEKKTSPGSKIRIMGWVTEVPINLRSGGKSTKFDLMVEVNCVETVHEDFRSIEISEEEEKQIEELSKDPKIYDKLIKSIAPSIFGYEKIKEALILQLIGGVRKERKDGMITRGDMHVLLCGDPGSGKSQLLKRITKVAPKGRYVSGKGATGSGLCVAPDSLVLTNPSGIDKIESLVEDKLKNNQKKYCQDVWQAKNPKTDKKVLSLNRNLKIEAGEIDQFWKLKAPPQMVEIKTRSGKKITVTPNTRLFMIKGGDMLWEKSGRFERGDFIATSRETEINPENKVLTISLIKSNPVVYGVKSIVKEMINKLIEEYKTKRKMARALGFSEDQIYYNWVNEKARGNIKLNDLKSLVEESETSWELIAAKIKWLSLYQGHKIKIPVYLNKELMYFAGLIAGDGDLSKGKNTTTIRFSNSSEELIKKFIWLSKRLFEVDCGWSSRNDVKRSDSVRFGSKLVFEILNSLGIPESPKSHRLDLSNVLLGLPNELLKEYLNGLFDTDGSVVERKKKGSYLDFSTSSENLAKKLPLVLLRFGILAKVRARKTEKSVIIKGNYSREIQPKHKKYSLEITGKENLEKFKEKIGFNYSVKKKKLTRITDNISKSNTNIDIIPSLQEKIKRIMQKGGLTSRDIFGYKRSQANIKKSNFSRDYLNKIVRRIELLYHENPPEVSNPTLKGGVWLDTSFDKRIFRIPETVPYPATKVAGFGAVSQYKNNLELEEIKRLGQSDIFWDEIKEIKKVKPVYDYVYDLTVKGSHNFLVDGFVIHNTAAVVRDEFLGGWSLEAGALVLSSNGFCCIDELDKMGKEDRAAMHEALEQQTVSISKANIQATLRCETTVLAAANPKFGRFDPYGLIVDQIDLPPTLINRFDLIFPIKDLPLKEKDEKMADHILILHQKPEEIKPEIETGLLKKYIAYARQRIRPEITSSALKEIKDYYLQMRGGGQTEEGGIKSIPITARQLEALIRLAEASAKIRLSEKVTKRDAQRAIDLINYCLSEVAKDRETGTIDIDRISTGIPAKERSKISIVREAIDLLEGEFGKVIPMENVVERCEEKGMKAEEVEEVIEKLRRGGDIYFPRPGVLSRI